MRKKPKLSYLVRKSLRKSWLRIIGDFGSGKTTLTQKYCQERKIEFPLSHELKFDFIEQKKNILGHIMLYDTKGQEKYKSLPRQYYERTYGAILVYDVTNRDSFLHLKDWFQNLKEYCQQIYTLIIGNKVDLEALRTVKTEEGMEFAKLQNSAFFETSKDSPKVPEIFEFLFSGLAIFLAMNFILRCA